MKKFPLILLALLAFLALPSWAAVVGTNTLALTNIATSSTLTGSSFIMNTRISGSLMGTRQVSFATVEAAFSNLVSEASITNIAATLDTAVSNSLRSFTLTVGLANTNNTTAVSNSLRSLSLALAASGSNNVTALSNSLYALIGTGGSTLTNANSAFTPLISTGAVKTISAGSNVTITDNGSNVVIAASLSGGAASLGDVTNTVSALSILASGGVGNNTILTNSTLIGGTGTSNTLLNPTVRGLTAQQLTNRVLIIGAGDSESALYYAASSTATTSPLNWPAWLETMPTWKDRYDYLPMAIPGQTLVQISNNLDSVYLPLIRAATNRVVWFPVQGGYNDKALGATDAVVSNTAWGISQTVRAAGAKTLVFDIIGYTGASAGLSNIVVNGGADAFARLTVASADLIDGIHPKPFGSFLVAQQVTNAIALPDPPDGATVDGRTALSYDTSPLHTSKAITLGGFYHTPAPGSSDSTNLLRPYVGAHSNGFWEWNNRNLVFGSYQTLYSGVLTPVVHHGVARGDGNSVTVAESPGTNTVVDRILGADYVRGWADTSGIIKFGMDGSGNIPVRGRLKLYDTQDFTDASSNVVQQVGRGTGVGTIAKSANSWGHRIINSADSWFVAPASGNGGLMVDGANGNLLVSNTVTANYGILNQASLNNTFFEDTQSTGLSGFRLRTGADVLGTVFTRNTNTALSTAGDMEFNVLTPAARFLFSHGTNQTPAVLSSNGLTFADGSTAVRAVSGDVTLSGDLILSGTPTNTGTLVAGLYQDDTGKMVKGPVSSGGGSGIDTNAVLSLATNLNVGGNLNVAGSMSLGSLVVTNLSVLDDPRMGEIHGLGVLWTATNEIVVSSGSAWIEADTNSFRFAGETVPCNSLSASAWHYVYLQRSNTVMSVVVTTTAPAPAFSGTARSQTNAPHRRLIYALKTDAGGGVHPFRYSPTKGMSYWPLDSSAWTALSGGSATSSTSVDCSGAMPPQSRVVYVTGRNTSTNATASVAPGDLTVVGSGGNRFTTWTAGSRFTTDVPTSPTQTLSYIMSTSPSGGDFLLQVLGWEFPR